VKIQEGLGKKTSAAQSQISSKHKIFWRGGAGEKRQIARGRYTKKKKTKSVRERCLTERGGSFEKRMRAKKEKGGENELVDVIQR